MVMMAMTVMWCRGRLRRARARLRCKNAGLNDKAEDRSQKQNVFYHEVFNTVENGKFQKNTPRAARRRGWSFQELIPIGRGSEL
jgi:hypothetical protein